MIKKALLTLLLATLGTICHAEATQKDKDLLKDGWAKYEFREFEAARRIFSRVQDTSKDKASICQAKTGLAFFNQFGQRGNVSVNHFEKAIELYDECIKMMGPDYKLTPFWKSMKAECNYRIYQKNDNIKNLKNAEAIWKELAEKQPKSLVAQDALLFRTVVPIRDFTDETVPNKIAEMETYLQPIKKKINNKKTAEEIKKDEAAVLAGIMANYLGKLYASKKNWLKSSENYDTYVKLGPTSHHYKLNAYYSIARIADVKLNDKKLAKEYYTKIFTESPTYRKSYFSMKRVKELGGKVPEAFEDTPKKKDKK